MRTPARPWFHARVVVPLTGREPLLGRLATRLTGLGPGWGQVRLVGPRGAGATRILVEALRNQFPPAGVAGPLFVGLAPADAPPLEPLRRALERRLAATTRQEARVRLEDALDHDVPLSGRALRWIYDGPGAGAVAPEPDLVHRLLRGLVPSGPLIAEDLERLDPLTTSVLLAESGPDGLGLLAVSSGPESGDLSHWPIPPLGAAQVDLLLRRWLRHPITARRLAPVVQDLYEGWPARTVRALRDLGRAGALVRERRGVAIQVWPLPWPPRSGAPADFTEFSTGLPPAERAVLDVGALAAEEGDAGILSGAAGVKPHVVEDLRAEVAERWPCAGGDLFPSRAERLAYARSLDARTRRRAAERLLAAWSRRPGARDRGARDAIARLEVAAEAGSREDVKRAAANLAAFDVDRAALGDELRALLSPAPRPAGAPAAPGLARARAYLLAGDVRAASETFDAVAANEAVPIPVRVEALARLAHARLRVGDEAGARRAARRASALLEALGRGPGEDRRLHRILAAAWGWLGEPGPAARHRHASRRRSRRDGTVKVVV